MRLNKKAQINIIFLPIGTNMAFYIYFMLCHCCKKQCAFLHAYKFPLKHGVPIYVYIAIHMYVSPVPEMVSP